MPKNREPVELVIAKGRKHFTKKDIEDRLSQQINVPFKDIEAPRHLSKKQKAEFYDIAYKLITIGVFTELDEEALARYIVSKDHYLEYSKLITKSLKPKKEKYADEEEKEEKEAKEIAKAAITTAKLITAQDKLFKQVRTAANDLGLTITSRLKLVIPEPPESYAEL